MAWKQPNYAAMVGAIAFAVFIFFPHCIDNAWAKLNFRSSRHADEHVTVTLSHDGFRAKSELQDVSLSWSAFTRATIFQDGVMLFRGPRVFHWIPFSSLEDQTDGEVMCSLVESRLTVRRYP